MMSRAEPVSHKTSVTPSVVDTPWGPHRPVPYTPRGTSYQEQRAQAPHSRPGGSLYATIPGILQTKQQLNKTQMCIISEDFCMQNLHDQSRNVLKSTTNLNSLDSFHCQFLYHFLVIAHNIFQFTTEMQFQLQILLVLVLALGAMSLRLRPSMMQQKITNVQKLSPINNLIIASTALMPSAAWAADGDQNAFLTPLIISFLTIIPFLAYQQ